MSHTGHWDKLNTIIFCQLGKWHPPQPLPNIWLNEREARRLASFLTNLLSAQRQQHLVSPAQSPTSCLPAGRQSSAQCCSQSI